MLAVLVAYVGGEIQLAIRLGQYLFYEVQRRCASRPLAARREEDAEFDRVVGRERQKIAGSRLNVDPREGDQEGKREPIAVKRRIEGRHGLQFRSVDPIPRCFPGTGALLIAPSPVFL